jgi:hypothetical protein
MIGLSPPLVRIATRERGEGVRHHLGAGQSVSAEGLTGPGPEPVDHSTGSPRFPPRR